MQQAKQAWVEYHQFAITCDNVPVEWEGRSENGVVALGERGGAVILTTIATGSVRYQSFVHQAEPELDSTWDDIVEVTLHTASGEMYVEGFGGMSFDEQNLASVGPGDYRLRVSARERGTEWDLSVETAQEQFRFDIWPTDQQGPERVIRAGEAPNGFRPS